MNVNDTESFHSLCRAFARLDSEAEVAAFLQDLCTIKEMQDMAQRFAAARLLDAGGAYTQVASEVGISSATISRVKRCLVYGAEGYRRAIDKIKE